MRNQNTENGFVGYEYKHITVPKSMDGLWTDGLNSFGWALDKKEPAVVKHLWGPLRVMMAPLSVFGGKFKESVVDHESATRVELTFKRDREIPGKSALNLLQPELEHSARSIESLEESKTMTASVAAYAIGLVGTVFLALATFAYLAGMSPLFIILAIPGFMGWILPFFAFHAVKNNKTKKIDPLIEIQHENIYTICQKADKMACEA